MQQQCAPQYAPQYAQQQYSQAPPQRPPLFVPEEAALSDPATLTKYLMDASVYARGTVDGVGFARLLEAAAQALQQQSAEAKVQRGLAIASQTLATELALKCEQLQNGLQPELQPVAPAPAPALLMGAGTPTAQRQSACSPPSQSCQQPAYMHSAPGGYGGAAAAVPSGFGPPPGGIGLAAGLSGVAGVGGLYPVPAAGAAPASAADVGDARDHGGLSKTWGQGEQHPSEPWGSAARPACATMQSTGQASADLEAERSVDAMVFNLKQRFKQSNVTLPLEKQSGSVYRLGSRKLQLAIRNTRLTVRVGSNYIDFLEYLSKAAL